MDTVFTGLSLIIVIGALMALLMRIYPPAADDRPYQ